MRTKSNKKQAKKEFERYIKTEVIPGLKSKFPNIKLSLDEDEECGFAYSLSIHKILVRGIEIYAGYYFSCFDGEDVQIKWESPVVSKNTPGFEIFNPTNAWFTTIAEKGTTSLTELKEFRKYFDHTYQQDILLHLKTIQCKYFEEKNNE